ncbi:MAG: cytochrome c3 family protein, partial [Nitrospirota bacterium]
MGKKIIIIVICLGIMLMSVHLAFSADPPHDQDLIGGAYDCSDCHSLHGAAGPGLTNQSTNDAVCMNCHISTAPNDAANKPFADAMYTTNGISHPWGAPIAMPGTSDPNNTGGLRATADLSSVAIKTFLTHYSDEPMCSVCHDLHSQRNASFNPNNEDSGTATGGSLNTVADTSKAWTVDAWIGYSVEMTGGLNVGEVRKIQSNTGTVLTAASDFTNPVAASDTYKIYGGDFQKIPNDLNQLCEDCHYYRTVASGNTAVRTYDGNKLSHPVGTNLASAGDTSQFLSVPADANYNAQTGPPRYSGDGAGDTNDTNNLIYDGTGNIGCMTCHNVHYADSDGSTDDTPPGSAGYTGDGNLLRRSQEETCHGCHKTEKNTPGADPNKLLMHNSDNLSDAGWGVGGWGVAGGQYGEFLCTTCHTGHDTSNIYLIKENITTPDASNWGDAGAQNSSTVSVDFRVLSGAVGSPGLMGDDQGGHATSTRICEVCHSKNTYHNYDTGDA